MENNENPVINNNTGNGNNNIESANKKTSKKKKSLIIIVVILIILIASILVFLKIKNNKNNSNNENNNNQEQVEVKRENKYSNYQLKDNNLSNFDLYFLQLENNKKNMVYSPLSIKYALEMLSEGASGETKYQITDILGTYTNKKYPNNKNMSFANALFIKNDYKNSIKETYINTLKNKYDADIYYDDFKSPNKINSWVSNKTFNLINNLYDNVNDKDYILANALGIDMEWVNKIQSIDTSYYVNFEHEKYSKNISALMIGDYTGIDFEGYNKKAKTAEIGAVINKYDIVNTLGEENIRKTVTNAYNEWLKTGEIDGESTMCGSPDNLLDNDKLDIDNYIKELKENYKHISSSTDFSFYIDNDAKVFAKDLKTYNDTTLEYIGIMPTKDTLSNFIKNTNATKINDLINNLKTIDLNNFKDGVITEINGYIPMFKFDYSLNLVNDLNTLGIKDVFDSEKSDLSNLTTDKASISDAKHEANIEFSNDGIKAAAATTVGGAGSGNCGFDYLYDVPVEKIDLTFDKPYMFIIRDKDSGEVWFTGTVYEPVEFISNSHDF